MLINTGRVSTVVCVRVWKLGIADAVIFTYILPQQEQVIRTRPIINQTEEGGIWHHCHNVSPSLNPGPNSSKSFPCFGSIHLCNFYLYVLITLSLSLYFPIWFISSITHFIASALELRSLIFISLTIPLTSPTWFTSNSDLSMALPISLSASLWLWERSLHPTNRW